MNDFNVSPASLRRAASAADAVAATLHGAHAARGLGHVATGMPGSASVGAASSAGRFLESAGTGAARDVDRFAGSLRTAATTFKATDVADACRVQASSSGLPTQQHSSVDDLPAILQPFEPPAPQPAPPAARPPLLPGATPSIFTAGGN